jgi:TetR/AcrR family transcriptional regulator
MRMRQRPAASRSRRSKAAPRRRATATASAGPRRTGARHSAESRRQQLIETGLRVFAKHGFRGATTRQLADAAGVTEAVIFKHFTDKNELYAAILEQKASDADAERWLAELEDLDARGADADVLRAVYRRIVGRHESDPHFLRLMIYSALEEHPLARRLQDSHGGRLYAFLERFVKSRQDTGHFRVAPPAVLVRLILALPVYHVVLRRLFKPSWPAVNPEELIETGTQCVLAGLTSAPRR